LLLPVITVVTNATYTDGRKTTITNLKNGTVVAVAGMVSLGTTGK
jgi:hypothetical protein